MRTLKTTEFNEWLGSEEKYTQGLVEARPERIRKKNHFGKTRALGDGLFELKWESGLRVYFGYVEDAAGQAALILLGGWKNGQNRDIAKARIILARETA